MLLKPDIKLDGITDITVDILKKYGIEGLLLDVDNTMSTHHGTELVPGLREWISLMLESGIKLTVLSNSLKFRIEPFANRIGLPFISTGLKPLPFGFIRGARLMKLKRRKVAIAGDQIFTDVLGGNAAGLKTILLTPVKLETSLRFRIKRKLERGVYKLYKIKRTEI